MPVARTTKPSVIGTSHSHDSLGVSPLASAKTNTGMKFIARLNAAVRDTDRGMAMRGKRTLRSIDSRCTKQATQLPVTSPR